MGRFRHALAGLRAGLQRTEVQVHLLIALGVIGAGVLVCLHRIEWILILFSIGLVLVAETANTALEELGNAVSSRPRVAVRRAKDLAAGAVLFAALTAAAVGLLVFLPALGSLQARSCLF